jgi:hypothetical protein
MKKFLTLLLLSAYVLAVSSCKKTNGEGPIVKETRNTSGFTGIELQLHADVFYTNDTASKLEVNAQQNILSILETFVSNNRLIIKLKARTDFRDGERVTIYVSAPNVNSFKNTTTGSINVSGSINQPSVYLNNDGSGSIYMQNIIAHDLKAINNGSGKITVGSGTVVNETLTTDASGKIDVTYLSAKSATAKIIGSGYIKLNASDYLHGIVDGSGSIYFKGFPELWSQINGSGNIIHF